MAESQTTASCTSSSFHDISEDEDCSSIHSSDYSLSTASCEHGAHEEGVDVDDDDDEEEEDNIQEDHESTAVEDLDEYVNMKQKETHQPAATAATEQRQPQKSMSDDDEDDSSASHWESETSSNISSGADEDDDMDGDDQHKTTTANDSDRQKYEEARARMLVQKHTRQPQQVQIQLQPSSRPNSDDIHARKLAIQQQQHETEVERLRKIREAENARIQRFAQKQQEEAERLRQQQKQQQRIQKEEARRKQALLQHFLDDEKRSRKRTQQDEDDAESRNLSEQKIREEEARMRALARRRQHIRNEESRQHILPPKPSSHFSSNATQHLQHSLSYHQRNSLNDDLSVNTGQSPAKPIVLAESSTTMLSPPLSTSPRPRPSHIDLTRASDEERYSPTPHRPIVSPVENQLPVPQSILEQIRQMQLQRQRQEQMDQERLQAEIERQSKQAQKNKIMREKYALSSSPPLSPKPDRRRYEYDNHPELEAQKMRVLTIEPRKFPASERMMEHHKQRMQHSTAAPLVVPAMFASDEDISTTGGSIRLFNKMMMQHQHHHRHAPPYGHPHRDVERGVAMTKSVPVKGSDASYCCICSWLSSRTELELFFVFVIIVTMMTLVVLFTLILTGKA